MPRDAADPGLEELLYRAGDGAGRGVARRRGVSNNGDGAGRRGGQAEDFDVSTFLIKNDYHDTETHVLVVKGRVLTRWEIGRAWQSLCGVRGCPCRCRSLGQRGPQDCVIEDGGPTAVRVRVKIPPRGTP